MRSTILHFWLFVIAAKFRVAWADENPNALYDYHTTPEVYVFDSMEQFDESVMHSEHLWMMQFCEAVDANCQKLKENYVILAKLFHGILKIGFVDIASELGKEISGRFQIQTKRIPALYWFLDDKNQPQLIDSIKDMQTIIGHMMETVGKTLSQRASDMGIGLKVDPVGGKKKDKGGTSGGGGGESKTVHVTGNEEFEEKVLQNPLVTMVAFTAPWCGHCKMLQPDWDEASIKLDGQGAQLVWIDATDPANEPIAGIYQVKGFPSIFIFPGGAPKSQNSARQYPGERKARDIVKFVLDEVDRTGTPKEIPQLLSPEMLKEECKGHNHICVLAFLPHILDSGASGRNGYREKLTKVSKTFRGSAFSFLWSEGGAQPTLESALELTFGYPALVAYSMDRHAFAVLHGSFSEKSMTSFLHGVTSGRTPVVKLAQEKVPKIETAEPWNGEDAAPPEGTISKTGAGEYHNPLFPNASFLTPLVYTIL